MKEYPELFKTVNRRNFLRGTGVALLLPQMVSLAGEKNMKSPTRMAFFHTPNGKIMEKWTPAKTGRNYKLTQTLQSLAPYKNDFSVISGLKHDKAKSNGDGVGDHTRAQATFLTGRQALKSATKFGIGISVDQVAANHLGKSTYLPSLELSTIRGRSSGSCDHGYHCGYVFNLSWASETKPMTPESNPALVFDRLFTSVDVSKMTKEQRNRLANRPSVLDYMLDSSRSLKRKLGKEDIERLDQYYTSVREIERKMKNGKPSITSDQLPRNFQGSFKNHTDKMEALMDLIILAWEADSTRICTMILGKEGSSRSFPEFGVKGGHHSLSHHGGNKEKIKALEKIDDYYVTRFAYFLKKLKEKQFNGKPLMEQSMVLYGCGTSDGNKHRHNNLPILLAGQANGKLKPGEHMKFDSKPLCNLYVSMLNKMGVPTKKFGDSNGLLKI